MSLDDTGRKEQMLSDMHDKLSQAVKLYDKLLTEQVYHPPWVRSPPPTAAASYQPVPSGYNPSYQTAGGPYSQYSQVQSPVQKQPPVQAPPVSNGYQRNVDPATPRQTNSPQVSYTNPAYAQEYHPQYANPVAESSYAPSVSSDAPLQQHLQYGEPSPQAQYAQPPQQFRHASHSLVSVAPPPPPMTQSNQPQLSYLPQSPTPYQPPLASIPQSPSLASSQQSPPAFTQPTQVPGLSRHNTSSYSSPRPSQSHHTQLARHNTIASSPSLTPQQVQQQQPILPQFPVAPTSAPQSFPMYGSSIPTGVPQPERKEALLIDL